MNIMEILQQRTTSITKGINQLKKGKAEIARTVQPGE